MNTFSDLIRWAASRESRAGQYRRAARAIFASVVLLGCVLAIGSAPAKAQFQELYRMTDGSFANHIGVSPAYSGPRQGIRAGRHQRAGEDHVLLFHR